MSPFSAVNTHVVQKVGAGLHTSAAAFWDPSTDGARAEERRGRCALRFTLLCPHAGKACVLWESASMQVVTTVFYLNV